MKTETTTLLLVAVVIYLAMQPKAQATPPPVASPGAGGPAAKPGDLTLDQVIAAGVSLWEAFAGAFGSGDMTNQDADTSGGLTFTDGNP